MPKLRCAILDDYQNAAMSLADWSPLAGRVDIEVLREHFESESALVARIEDKDIVVVMRERTPFPASLFARLPRLKLVVTSGMRNAAIDVKAAAARGITVSGTASSSRPPVELTFALILGLARRLVQENVAFRTSGPWQSFVGTDLYGKRLGLLGLGKIGAEVAKVGVAFGMDVVAWSQNLTAARAAEVGVRLAESKGELLATSDFVSVHLVLSDRTRGLVGATDLACMKPSAFLINTSRAAIVDEDALMVALQQKRLAGAGIDVFTIEPVPAYDALRSTPNLLATPHLGYVTENNYRTYFREAIANIEAFLGGKSLRTLG